MKHLLIGLGVIFLCAGCAKDPSKDVAAAKVVPKTSKAQPKAKPAKAAPAKPAP